MTAGRRGRYHRRVTHRKASRANERTRYAVALALLAIIAMPVRVFACTCVCDQVRTTAEQVENSSAIVIAEVLEVIDQTDVIKPGGERWSNSCGESMLQLKTREVLKGELPPQLFVRRAAIGTACDVKFELQVGSVYLLYLSGENTCLQLSGCLPSQPLAEGSAVLTDTRAQLQPSQNDTSK